MRVAVSDHCQSAFDVLAAERRIRQMRDKFFGIKRKKITSYGSISGSVEARFQFFHVVEKPKPPVIPLTRIEQIIRTVSLFSRVTKAEIISENRHAEIVKIRHVTMILIKVLYPISLPEIGRKLGGRDHTTVLHALRKCAPLFEDLKSKADWPLNDLVPYAFARFDELKPQFLRRDRNYSVSKSVEKIGATENG